VIYAQSALRLPLVHHLVQQRVLDLGPGMTSEMPATDSDLQRPARPNLNRQLTQPGPHAAGQTDGDLTERSTEMPGIQLMMERDQLVQQKHVARASPLS
jgi:hypothetical protein